MSRCRLHVLIAGIVTVTTAWSQESIRVSVTIDRGEDLGQSFGSLFEAESADGRFILGAGFSNAYNTRYRANRHAVQFYIRPVKESRQLEVKQLPRPTDHLTGAYLFERGGNIYSTYGGLQQWNAARNRWEPGADKGGTQESMRLGHGVLTFGHSRVLWNDSVILEPPAEGTYQLFFYANGHLCFYHVNRKDGPYRKYTDDTDGFSRLYAVPWSPKDRAVDLERAITFLLPVVGETTFAWGQLGNQIVTGSNIGGFYRFQNGKWDKLLEPDLTTSYQLYSSLGFGDKLLMGQYPTGRLFEYDGEQIRDLNEWPPVPPGVRGSAREAQTTCIYGGELIAGVWPWGELWRYSPDAAKWDLDRRMFDHPAPSDKVTHPYDIENEGNSPQNRWGQRVTSLVPNRTSLFISTSAKAPYEWEPGTYSFLEPDLWKSYGLVYEATMPGHLSIPIKWTEGKTTLSFVVSEDRMTILQDGRLLGSAKSGSGVANPVNVKWGDGLFGPHACQSLSGTIEQ